MDETPREALRSRVAPEGAEGLDGARPEDVLVVERRDGSARERAHPEDPLQKRVNQITSISTSAAQGQVSNKPQKINKTTYVVIPGLVLVVDDGGAQAPGRVDAGAGDGDGGQVDHEHGEPDGEGSQNLPKKKIHGPVS